MQQFNSPGLAFGIPNLGSRPSNPSGSGNSGGLTLGSIGSGFPPPRPPVQPLDVLQHPTQNLQASSLSYTFRPDAYGAGSVDPLSTITKRSSTIIDNDPYHIRALHDSSSEITQVARSLGMGNMNSISYSGIQPTVNAHNPAQFLNILHGIGLPVPPSFYSLPSSSDVLQAATKDISISDLANGAGKTLEIAVDLSLLYKGTVSLQSLVTKYSGNPMFENVYNKMVQQYGSPQGEAGGGEQPGDGEAGGAQEGEVNAEDMPVEAEAGEVGEAGAEGAEAMEGVEALGAAGEMGAVEAGVEVGVAAGPLGWAALGVVAAGVGIYEVATHWDDISNWARRSL